MRLDTRDGVRLDSDIAEPGRRRRADLVEAHSCGSVFFSAQPMIRALSTRLDASGIRYFKFNTRGHG